MEERNLRKNSQAAEMCLWCRRCSQILGTGTPRVGHNDLSTGFASRWSAACLKSTKAFARFSPAALARRPPPA